MCLILLQLTSLNSLSASPTKWSNTLKQFVGNLPTNCLSVFDHFVKLALKGLRLSHKIILIFSTQLTFTCSKSTTEALKKAMKRV